MKEIDRIDQYTQSEVPEGSKLVLTIDNVEGAEQILLKAKDIMKCISKYAYTDKWPEEEEWKSILPEWFVDSMVNKSLSEIVDDKYQWHFESWVDSMRNRAWEWYSSEVKGSNIIITIKLLSVPYIFEQFIYVFYAQGVLVNKISDVDDIYGYTKYE